MDEGKWYVDEDCCEACIGDCISIAPDLYASELKQYLEEPASSQDKAREFLMKLGTHTKEGALTDDYKTEETKMATMTVKLDHNELTKIVSDYIRREFDMTVENVLFDKHPGGGDMRESYPDTYSAEVRVSKKVYPATNR